MQPMISFAFLLLSLPIFFSSIFISFHLLSTFRDAKYFALKRHEHCGGCSQHFVMTFSADYDDYHFTTPIFTFSSFSAVCFDYFDGGIDDYFDDVHLISRCSHFDYDYGAAVAISMKWLISSSSSFSRRSSAVMRWLRAVDEHYFLIDAFRLLLFYFRADARHFLWAFFDDFRLLIFDFLRRLCIDVDVGWCHFMMLTFRCRAITRLRDGRFSSFDEIFFLSDFITPSLHEIFHFAYRFFDWRWKHFTSYWWDEDIFHYADYDISYDIFDIFDIDAMHDEDYFIFIIDDIIFSITLRRHLLRSQ